MVKLSIGGKRWGVTHKVGNELSIEMSEKSLASPEAHSTMAHELYHSSYSPRRGRDETFGGPGLPTLGDAREELEAAFFAAERSGYKLNLNHLRWVWGYMWDAGLTKENLSEELREAAERVGYKGALPPASKFKDRPGPRDRGPIGSWSIDEENDWRLAEGRED